MNKIKITKLTTDFIGYTVGCVASGVMVLATYSFLKHGGIIFYEQNKILSLAEFIAAIFGTGYFSYKILKMLTNKELDKYIKNK